MTITREMFDPSLDLSDSRIVVDPDSRRIAVRVAEFGEVHSGHSGEVRVPRNVNVDAAHIGRVRLGDGEFLPVAQLPMGTLHATGGISAEEAAQVYENTGRSVARVRYSVDEVGIRADGVLYDDVSDTEVERLVASAPSGDWRALSHIRRFSDFENTPSDFVGAAVVNIPGYSGSFRKQGAEALRLVASGDGLALIDDVPDEADADCGGTDNQPCDGCSCGRADELTASAGDMTDGNMTDDHTAEDARIRLIEDRIQVLEQIIADAILGL